MACCLTAPSHYLNLCWLIISKVLWHLSEGIIMRRSEDTNQKNKIENYIFRITFRSSRGQWVNALQQVLVESLYKYWGIVFIIYWIFSWCLGPQGPWRRVLSCGCCQTSQWGTNTQRSRTLLQANCTISSNKQQGQCGRFPGLGQHFTWGMRPNECVFMLKKNWGKPYQWKVITVWEFCVIHKNNLKETLCYFPKLWKRLEYWKCASLTTTITQELGNHLKNAHKLFNQRALRCSSLNKILIFQCMDKIFCMEFQRVPSHTIYVIHILKVCFW